MKYNAIDITFGYRASNRKVTLLVDDARKKPITTGFRIELLLCNIIIVVVKIHLRSEISMEDHFEEMMLEDPPSLQKR